MVRALPPTLLGTRDQAFLVLGFACALRWSEIAALDVSDMEFPKERLHNQHLLDLGVL